jgi:hypothetical protein
MSGAVLPVLLAIGVCACVFLAASYASLYREKPNEVAMYDIRIAKIGVVPMTSRFDLIKIFAIAAILGGAFYYLAHYGLSLPQR